MILDKFSLAGRSAIVTGASRGLGAAMALGLAEAGANVAVVASSDRVQDTVKQIRAMGREAIAIQADLGRTDCIPDIITATKDAFDRIDILINCAGVIRRKPALEVSEEEWDEVINLNQRSLFFLCQAAAREMMQQKKGKIINIASLLSFQGGVIVPAYAASKAAIAGLTKALANEWAPYGINVNAIAPGYMETELTEALQHDPGRGPTILARIPAGRWGTPEDMKGAAVYLAADASDYLHGHILALDGGWLGR